MRWICALFIFYSANILADQEIWLKIGEVHKLSAPRDAVVRLGSRQIVRAVESGSHIQIIGLKPGVTTLTIDARSYIVRVSLQSQKTFATELRQLISTFKGLELNSDTPTLQVKGVLLRFSDWEQMAKLAAKYQGEYEFRAQALSNVAQDALKHFTQLIKQQGIPALKFSSSPQFTIHVPKNESGLEQLAQDLFQPFGVNVQTSASTLPIEPLIRTRVILAELVKGYSETFGIEWPSQYQAQLLPFSAPKDLVATLKALEAKGHAQILASPNLLCRSGGEARFHAGGEFPIRMISRQGRDVLWKPHGVLLQVKPVADFQGAIRMEISTEISMLDAANAVDGVPAIKKNSVSSHFDLPGRRTIALSGLLRQEFGRSQEGLPLLSSLPVLGPLFSSQHYRNHRSELVVFVTPEVHSTDHDEALTLPKGWVRDNW